MTAVAASLLTPGSVLILVRRADVKGGPLLALRVPLPKGGQAAAAAVRP